MASQLRKELFCRPISIEGLGILAIFPKEVRIKIYLEHIWQIIPRKVTLIANGSNTNGSNRAKSHPVNSTTKKDWNDACPNMENPNKRLLALALCSPAMYEDTKSVLHEAAMSRSSLFADVYKDGGINWSLTPGTVYHPFAIQDDDFSKRFDKLHFVPMTSKNLGLVQVLVVNVHFHGNKPDNPPLDERLANMEIARKDIHATIGKLLKECIKLEEVVVAGAILKGYYSLCRNLDQFVDFSSEIFKPLMQMDNIREVTLRRNVGSGALLQHGDTTNNEELRKARWTRDSSTPFAQLEWLSLMKVLRTAIVAKKGMAWNKHLRGQMATTFKLK